MHACDTNRLQAFDSFDEWLSTELERMRCVGMLTFLRDDADRTDLGLEFTPNRPFWCERDQGALRVLRGESGALLYTGYLRIDSEFGMLFVERYGLS